MKMRFIEEGHIYESKPARKWISGTSLVEKFVNHFDDAGQAVRSSENPYSKWFTMNPETILTLWDQENKRATNCGSWFHSLMEGKALAAGTKKHRGKLLRVIPPILKDGYKLAPAQQLEEGVYPEHFMYDEVSGVCGQSDLVYVCEGFVDIDDYKTNKEIDFRGYGWKYGDPQMMTGIMSNIEDCNFNHYVLQLSIYMYLILLKNPHLKPGRMRICHVTFENEGFDEYGFPILKRTPDGGYIPTGKTWYEIPYLKNKVAKIFKQIAG
jgi:hypothetical protein